MWHVNCEMENYLSSELTSPREEQSLVWPPMLLVCIHGLEAKEEALSGVRELLVSKELQADVMSLTEFMCSEGNTFYDLFVLPPTGLAFAAAKAIDGIIRMTYTCYYPSLQDMIDIRSGKVPEFSRRFIPNLRYHGMDRPAWSNLRVDLLRDDGVCVARGVCQKSEPTDCVDGEVLGDMHVAVQVLEIVKDLVPFNWEGTVRRWKTSHVLHAGVSLFERFRQLTCSRMAGSYCEDSEVDLDIQKTQGVLKDHSLTSVAPWYTGCEGDEDFYSLSDQCSKICQDALHDIEESSLQTSLKNILKEQEFNNEYCDRLPFEEKLQRDEEIRMRQLLISLTDSSTKRVLMTHLATSNGLGSARGVVKRLKVLHRQDESGKDSNPISIMIKGAEDIELSALRSIKQQVQLEGQQESVLSDMHLVGKQAILKMREHQHESLLKLLAENEASQTSKLEEFVNSKFKFVTGIQRTEKETESVIAWSSQYIARATNKIKRAHMTEKRKWEEQMARSEEQEAKLKFELQAAKREANEQAAKSKIELEAARREAEARAVKSEIDLKARQEMEEQATQSMIELEAVKKELHERNSATPLCIICFEMLEGSSCKKDNVVLRQRACFIPCMHASACSKCSCETWEKFKRCPVCNGSCYTKPLPLFV